MFWWQKWKWRSRVNRLEIVLRVLGLKHERKWGFGKAHAFWWCQTPNDPKLFQDVDKTSNRGCTQAIHSVLLYAALGQAEIGGNSLGWVDWGRLCGEGHLSAPSAFSLLLLAMCPIQRLGFFSEYNFIWKSISTSSSRGLNKCCLFIQHSFNYIYRGPTVYQAPDRTLGGQALKKKQTQILALMKLTL